MRAAVLILLLVGLAAASRNYNDNRRRSFNQDSNNYQYSDSDSGRQQQQQPQPFQPNYQYTYMYNGQISAGLDTNDQSTGDEPQQKAMTRIQAQAQITFQSGNRAVLHLEQIRVGQLNKHIEAPQHVQPMGMFERKSIQEDKRRQLELPVQFEYEQGVVRQIHFSHEDKPWSKNIKRSVLNLIQLNLGQQQQQQGNQQLDSQEQDQRDNQEDSQSHLKTKTFTLPEITIEGDCLTTYTINKHNKRSQRQSQIGEEDQQDDSDDQQQTGNQFNVTKSINFKQCKKIADVAYGYQTEQQQPECAKCQQPWKQQSQSQSKQQQQQGPQQTGCEQCDPKEIKESKLDRTTVLRFVLSGQPQKYGIKRAELISQYVYKNLRAENSQYSSAMHTIVAAELVFRNARSAKDGQQQHQQHLQGAQDDSKKSTLLYDNSWDVNEKRFFMNGDDEFSRNSPFEGVPKVEQAQQILRKLTHAASDKINGIEFDQLVLLQRLVEIFRMSSVEELNQIYQTLTNSNQQSSSSGRSESEQQKVQQILADTLAIAGTRNTIFVLAKKINNGDLKSTQAFQALKSLTGLVAPSDKQVDIVLHLCQNEAVHRSGALKQTCWLAFGSMVGELCKKQSSKQNSQEEIFGTQSGFSQTNDICSEPKKQSYKQALVEQYEQAQSTYEKVLALKALGNAGIDIATSRLEKIIRNQQEDRIVRAQAIDSLRRLRTRMPRKIQRVLLPIFQNTREAPEVRMTAFNMILHTNPEKQIVDQITYTLIKERNPQVQSFVYTAMKALTKSKVPCEQQLAKHLKNTLKLVNVDEQSLRSSRRYQVPIYSEEQKEGVFLNLASVFNGQGILPTHLAVSLDSLLNDEYEMSTLRVGLTQRSIEQWYESLMHNFANIARNQQQQSGHKMRAQRSTSQHNGEQELRDIFQGLKIKRRRGSYRDQQDSDEEGQQQSQDNNNQQRQQQRNEPFAMICVRIDDVDQAILPIDRQTAPHCLKQLMNGERPSMRSWIDKLQDVTHFRTLTAMNLNEKSGKIPTSLGVPLRILQAMPLMAAIEGNVRANMESRGSDSPVGIRVQLNLHPSVCVAHIQKMESWLPIIVTGVESTRAVELNKPIQAEIEADTKQGITIRLKTPQVPRTRIFGLHTLPSTYTRDWDAKTKMLREPKLKSINNPQLEQLQMDVNQQVGDHAFGMPFHIRGHFHWPARATDYKQVLQLIMATENHVHITFEPKENTPKEIILRLGGNVFQKASSGDGNHGPELDNFYSKASKFEKAYPDDDFEESDNEDHDQRREKLNGFLNKFQPSKRYQHSLKLSAETRGGRKEVKAQLQVKTTCDAKFKYCKLFLDVQRTPMYQNENNDWTLKSKLQILMPDAVSNVQQLDQLQNKHQKFVWQSETEWGSDHKQYINLRVQGDQFLNQQQREQLNSQQGAGSKYQQKQAAFLNKFDVVAEYKLRPPTENVFNQGFEVVKVTHYWNTQSQLQQSGRDGQLHATVVIDPISQQYANISVKTSGQAVRIQSVPLPMRCRPFPLVRESDKSTHSVSQLVKRMAEGKGRAECTVDGKRVETFDGVQYKAPVGKCYSVLAKDCAGSKPRFVVLMKALNGDSQGDKKIKVITRDQTIVCQPSSQSSGRSGKKLECRVNEQPVNDNDNSSNQDESSRVVEYNNEEQTDVTITVQGVQVRFGCTSGTCKNQKVWIKISNHYKQGQCGLCGNYDDQSNDELRTNDNELTDDLTKFHRSFSVQNDAECSSNDQEEFYGQQNKKKFVLLNRMKKSNNRNEYDDNDDDEQSQYNNGNNQQDDEEDDQQDDEDNLWQAGGYQDESSEENQWRRQGSSSRNSYNNNKRRQQGQRQGGNQNGGNQNGQNDEEEPIEMTKVVEFNHKICFSVQPVMQCPEGTSPADQNDTDFDDDSTSQSSNGSKKIQFACLSRSSSEARRLQRQARKGVPVNLPNQSPSFVEAVKQPTRCVAY